MICCNMLQLFNLCYTVTVVRSRDSEFSVVGRNPFYTTEKPEKSAEAVRRARRKVAVFRGKTACFGRGRAGFGGGGSGVKNWAKA